MASQKVKFDIGEQRHVRIDVQVVSGDKLPFLIRAARYELIDPDGNLEESGECAIEDHEIDAYIFPVKTGSYTLKYIYEVADEIWIDPVKVVVS